MSQNRHADEFYKILCLWEDAFQKRTLEKDSYLKYLNRLFVKYDGLDKQEIYALIKGLYELKDNAGHETVKSVVFHLIELGGE